MGQAFDENGNVLGEAYGDTKREVFEKLNAEHRDAMEIRIRTLKAKADVAETRMFDEAETESENQDSRVAWRARALRAEAKLKMLEALLGSTDPA